MPPLVNSGKRTKKENPKMINAAPIRDSELVEPEVINQTEVFRAELSGVRLEPPTVKTAGDAERTAEEVRTKKDLRDKFRKFFTPFTEAAHKRHRATTAHRDAVINPLETSINIDERAIGRWNVEEQERVRRETERVQAQTDIEFNKQIDKRAKQLEKAGKPDEAEGLRQQAEINRPTVSMPAVETPKGVVAPKQEWDYEIVDPMAVPRAYCEPSDKLIAGSIKLLGRNAQIPGVRIFPREAKASVRR